MVQIRGIKNPKKINEAQVHCEVEVKEGDGVGARFEWCQYVAVRGDVAATGNLVWARLCAGDFTCDEEHELNFDHSELLPDSNVETA